MVRLIGDAVRSELRARDEGAALRECGYDLGIDLGTTWTAAAVRPVGGTGVHVVPLEAGSWQVPSVLLVDADGGLLVGSEAERHAARAPERVVREFKRRLGDETPIVVAGTSFSADGVAAEMVCWTADRVAARHGVAPRRLSVSHPAGWGGYRRRVFTEALAEVGLHDVVLIAEPEAAALAHAAAGRVPPGRTVAVYDLGGGTFDAAVVRGVDPRPGGAAVTLLGRGQGIETLGGIDFDEALFWHVCAELGGAVAALDPADRDCARSVAVLRRACVAAKEALSRDTEVVVPVDLPTVRTQVRVTRGEFEEMISPALRRTVDVLGDVLDAADLPAGRLDGVLLVGGSSRIPLVARVLAHELGRPVVVDPDPTTAVARGAAVAAGLGRGVRPSQTGPWSSPFPTPRSAPGPAPRPAGGPRVLVTATTTAVSPGGPIPVPRPEAARTGVLLAPEPARSTTADVAGATAGGRPRRVAMTVAEPPTAPLRLEDLRAVPARPPRRVLAEADALPLPADPPRRRRRVMVAVGTGVAIVAGGVVAVTVPMITSEASPRAQTGPLAPAGVAAPTAAPAPSAAPTDAAADDVLSADDMLPADDVPSADDPDRTGTRAAAADRTPAAPATAPEAATSATIAPVAPLAGEEPADTPPLGSSGQSSPPVPEPSAPEREPDPPAPEPDPGPGPSGGDDAAPIA